MSGNYITKAIIITLVLGWSIMNIVPINDTPFDKFITSRVSANNDSFDKIFQKAQDNVDSGKSPSIFVALNQIGLEDKIDFSQFFPEVNLADIKNLEKRNNILLRYLLTESQGKLKLGLDLKGGVAFTLKVDDASLANKDSYSKEQQLNKAIDIMERRINGLGVAEPIIRARGDNSLEIQLPGLSTQENPDVLANLQKPAKLTFHRVHRTLDPSTTPASKTPLGYTIMNLERSNPTTGEITEIPLFVKKVPDMGGSSVKDSGVYQTEFGGFEIALNFTDNGAVRFAEITEAIDAENKLPQYANLPENHPLKYGSLAIVLDGQLYSAPRIIQAITAGRASITGKFTQREAFELSNVLNNPLEFELKLEEMYEVGPTLADDARSASINAALLGAGLVVAFMCIYYLSAGLVAVIAVAFNMLIVLGVMASLGATMTLPGVAALVLTIGMAVDSNILIFERIREELKLGKKLNDALYSGFDKAFSTILDANLTTLLTAGILIWLGTGPIKGFGVTLSIGIGATMFCALVVSKLFLEILVKYRVLKNILTFSLFKESNFKFLELRRPAFVLSGLLALAGIFSIYTHRDHIYGIDFLGGDEISINFTQKLGLQEIDEVAANNNLGEIVPVYQTLLGSGAGEEILKIQTHEGQGRAVFDALKATFPEANLQLAGESSIGAAVSGSIKTNALLALGVAMLGILLYIAFRFEIGYGIGAVVSTIHDVVISIGLFVLLGGQFTAPMVAAILMIVGYSINDTIVVFDRIREELLLDPTSSLKKIINHAINKTLSRTILTSLTTLMAALALYIFGAGVINDFALVFMIGIVIGTFSSIFIASPVFYWWHRGNRRNVEAGELRPKYNWEAGTSDKTTS